MHYKKVRQCKIQCKLRNNKICCFFYLKHLIINNQYKIARKYASPCRVPGNIKLPRVLVLKQKSANMHNTGKLRVHYMSGNFVLLEFDHLLKNDGQIVSTTPLNSAAIKFVKLCGYLKHIK